MATLLTGGLILMLGQADQVYDPGYLIVEADRIAAVGAGGASAAPPCL